MGCAFTMITLQLYIKQKHQEAADEVDIFCDGIIRRGLVTSQEFMLGFTIIKEIEFDWEDKTITAFEESKLFKEVIQELFRKEAIKDFHARRKLKIEPEHKEQFKKDVTLTAMEDTSAVIEYLRAHPELDKMIELPFVFMKLEDLKIDKEKLKSFHYYYGLMYDEECFIDQSVGYERAFLILPDKKERMLEGYRRVGFDHDDYPINIRSCVCYWICVGWVLDNIPILMLRFSENMIEEQVEEVLKADEIKYLQIEALVHLLNMKRGEETQKDLKLDRLEVENVKIQDEYYLMVQDLKKKEIRSMGTRSDRVNIQILEEDLLKKTKMIYFAFAIILALAVILIIVLVSTVSLVGNVQPPAPPTQEGNLSKTLFNLLRIIYRR